MSEENERDMPFERYTEEEIVDIYKRGHNKKEQLFNVLPQLTLLSRKDLIKILKRHGCELPKGVCK